MSNDVTTICAGFQHTKLLQPDAVAFRTPGDGVTVTWREFDERVTKVAAGLHALGVRRGDIVSIMMRNRPEFPIVDIGALHTGAATVSAYNSSTPEQLAYVLDHADARVMICEEMFLGTVLASGHELDHIICIDGKPEGATMTLEELEAAGADDFDFDATWNAVEPSDIATLIYTSGTTGPPKGVQISHGAVVNQTDGVRGIYPQRFGDRFVSFLPAAHIADRVAGLYWMVMLGLQTTYVADPKELVPALIDTRPTIWFAVPRVWEKFRAAIEAKVAAETDEQKKAFALRAIELGRAKGRAELAGEELPADQLAEWEKADTLVLSQLRSALGLDGLVFGISGAAPIAVETLEFFLAIGVKICEVWGMSETCGIGTLVPVTRMKLGTCGPAWPGSELKLAEDGELLFRGPGVMSGYRNDPDRTAETLDSEGWVHTGDIATIDEDGYIKIVDRKKELIISAAGKNMSPSNIENTIKAACPLIATFVVIGDGRHFNTALITIDPDAGAAVLARSGSTEVTAEAMAGDPGIQQIVAKGVEEGNASLARVEQVKKYVILPTFWEAGGDELTPTSKLKRKPITEKYAAEIEQMYA